MAKYEAIIPGLQGGTLPASHCYVVFILQPDEALPPFDMAINGIGTAPGNNRGLTFKIGRKEFDATFIDDMHPVVLIHHSDSFKIVNAESWPIFVSAVVRLDTYSAGARS
jgi:hypothetical protein